MHSHCAVLVSSPPPLACRGPTPNVVATRNKITRLAWKCPTYPESYTTSSWSRVALSAIPFIKMFSDISKTTFIIHRIPRASTERQRLLIRSTAKPAPFILKGWELKVNRSNATQVIISFIHPPVAEKTEDKMNWDETGVLNWVGAVKNASLHTSTTISSALDYTLSRRSTTETWLFTQSTVVGLVPGPGTDTTKILTTDCAVHIFSVGGET